MDAKRGAWLAAALTLLGSPCWATEGLVVNDFEPAETGSSWFVLQSRLPRQPLAVTAGLVFDHAVHPVTVYDSNENDVVEFIEHQLYGRLGAGLRLFKRYAVNVSLPVLLSTAGESILMGDRYFTAPHGTDVGDVRLELTYWVPPLVDAFDVYAGARVWLPTGNPERFTGDGALRVAPQAGLAGNFSMFAYAARATVELHLTDNRFADQDWGTRLQVAGAFGIELDERRLTVGPEVFASTELGDDILEGPVTKAEALLGAHYFLWERWRFGLGGGFGLTTGIGTPEVRLLAMASWNLLRGGAEVPPPPQEPVYVEPPPPVPEPPPPAPPLDTDGDGIEDTVDACINEKGDRAEDPKLNGCPPPADQDKDGILDPVDACVVVAGVASADASKHGCPPPASTDNDGDGIENAVDACPDKPGVASPEPSANGCPQAKLVGAKIEILGRIEFETRRSELLPESEPVLQAVLHVLQNQPSILRLSIEGHTDNRGAAATNEALSLRRAESVLAWLVIQGIDPARLVAQGYGPRKPIDTNDTDAGRRNNRRVEFNVLEFAKEQGGAP